MSRMDKLQQKMLVPLIRQFMPQIADMAPVFIEKIETSILEALAAEPLQENEAFIGVQGLQHNGQMHLNIVAFNHTGLTITRLIKSINLSQLAREYATPQNIMSLLTKSPELLNSQITPAK